MPWTDNALLSMAFGCDFGFGFLQVCLLSLPRFVEQGGGPPRRTQKAKQTFRSFAESFVQPAPRFAGQGGEAPEEGQASKTNILDF